MTSSPASRRATRSVTETILVISDLHLTSGRDLERGVWSPTEDFFWDGEFRDFLEHHSARGRCRLIINGDLFDFLQVLSRPSPEEARLYGIPPGDISAVYGLKSSEAATVFLVDRIVDGHLVAFGALARFLADNNRVVLLRGNHDVQMFWSKPRERLRQRLEELAPRASRGRIRKNLEIVPWIYRIPALLYVEHGNQYESATSFRNFLLPLLPFDSAGAGRHIELDLGSMIIRYFANRMEPLDPLSDNIRPLSAYVRTFVRRHPLIFASTAKAALSYIINALSKARRMEKGATGKGYREIVRKNEGLIAGEAARIAATPNEAHRLEELLRRQDGRKAPPILGRGPLPLFWHYVRPSVQLALTLLPLAGLLMLPWEWWILCVAASIFLWWWIVRRNAARRAGEDTVRRLRSEAERIADEFDVRFVVFGHTHVEDVRLMSGGRWYFNTGTWISVFSETEYLYREPRQFTFLRIEKGRGSLLFWDPERKVPREAVVVDPEAAHAPPVEDLRSLVRKALRLRWLRLSIDGSDRTLAELLKRFKRKTGR